MTNKGFNPLFVSALDILTGALGVFIILNFLHTRLVGVPPVPVNPPGLEKKNEQDKTYASNKPRPADEPRAWWRKPAEPQPVPPPPTSRTQQPHSSNPQSETPNPQSPIPNPQTPQDPVAVDLMKQTKGAVVILLQQADQSKQPVEFMLRQGNRTWKPSRVSKYQDNGFRYEKALTYFYQTEIEPGTYEVLVKVKRGQKGGGQKPFSLYGKLVPPGQKAQTYSFGNFAIGGSEGDWVPAGSFKVSAAGLQYQSKLPAAAKTETEAPPTTTQPANIPTPKPSGRNGKWG